MLDILRKYGTPCWITDSQHFEEFLDLAYSGNFKGEIWLFNNDLKVITNKDLFETLYINGIFGKHRGNVSAVKILVNSEYYDEMFSTDGTILSNNLRTRFRTLHAEKDGDNKLASLMFGRLNRDTYATEPSLPANYTAVFYLHGSALQRNSSSGIVMIRPHMFPFVDDDFSYSIVWQLVDQPDILSGRLRPFNHYFSQEEMTGASYSHVAVDECGTPRLIPETPSSYKPLSARESIGGWLLGQETDFLILTSNQEELSTLEEVFNDEMTTCPLRDQGFRLAIFQRFNKVTKIAFGLTDAGTSLAAIRTFHAIKLWKPRDVIFVGTAGGDPDDNDLRIGDIVVGETIIGYEKATVSDIANRIQESNNSNEEKSDKEKGNAHDPLWEYAITGKPWDASWLKSRAQKIAESWRPELSYDAKQILSREDNRVRVLVQPIASGNKLILSPNYFRMLRGKTDDRIKAAEMEGDGVGYACSESTPIPSMIMIRGILDKCNPHSRGSDGSRSNVRKAVGEIVAKFVRELLISTL